MSTTTELRACAGCGEDRDHSTPLTPAARGDVICTHCSRIAPTGPNTHAPFDPEAPILAGCTIEFISGPTEDPSMLHAATVIRMHGDYVQTWSYGWVHRDRLIAVFRPTA